MFIKIGGAMYTLGVKSAMDFELWTLEMPSQRRMPQFLKAHASLDFVAKPFN